MKCPECANTKMREDANGEIICITCGLVIDEARIENGFVDETIQSRATIPYLQVAETKFQEGKIVKSFWMLSTREKNLQIGLNKIEQIGSRINLPKLVIKESKIIFKRALYTNAGIGRNNNSLTYASVYIASNMHGIPKTALELTAYTEINTVDLMRAYRIIRKKLELTTKTIDPIDLLHRFASKLELKPETINETAEILIKIKESTITAGRKPETILAGAIYTACKKTNDHRTQRQIANTLGIIEITIRKIHKEIINK